MSDNYFIKPIDFYQRDLDPIKNSIEQNAYYVSKMTGKSITECEIVIKQNLNNRELFKVNNPVVTYYERDDNEDKHKKECRLTEYFNDVINNEEILVPTFTSYLNTNKRKSLLVGFVDYNVARRSKAKKEAFKAKTDNKPEVYIMKNNEQSNMKLYNNAMSGGFATEGSVLNNPTAHSTLTSMVRMESSIANASNEKIIAGNRFYKDPDVTLFNVISICKNIDKDKLVSIMEKYNLYYPTKEDVIKCIRYSSDLYWKDIKGFKEIERFVDTLDDYERAGFVYTSDLYHIRVFNDSFIRNFLGKLSKKVTDKIYDDPISIINNTDPQITNTVHQICLKETKGKGKNYESIPLEDLNIIAATCENIYNTIRDYKDFIDVFFLTKNMPNSSGYIPNMIRRVVVLSDTDSTMFSIDEFVTWYFGKLIFNDESFALAVTVMYLASQCITHQLAMYSANINVERKKLFSIAMKPEYTFPVFAQTSVAKHYFTYKTVQEGNVFNEPEVEIKGVHLINSAAPKSLIKPAKEKMLEVLFKISNNEQISLVDEIKYVANIERKIIASLINGDIEFYKKSKIKNPEAYSRSEEHSPYVYHLLWEQVFADKYGKLELPPYDVLKIPTKVNNITELKRWLSLIADKDFASRLENWMTKNNKVSIPTIFISLDYIRAYGIPEEIKHIINIENIALELTIMNRMILETLGYFPKTGILLSSQGY